MKAKSHLRFLAFATSFVPVAIGCSDVSSSERADSDMPPSLPVPAEDGGAAREDSSDDASTNYDALPPERSCTDAGWCHTVVPDKQTLRDVWGDREGVVWAVSEQGNILRWDGTAWVHSYSAGVPLYTIWGSGPTDLWAGGGAPTSGNLVLPGTLLHGTGPSASAIAWTAVPTPVTIRSIWGTSAIDIWAVASVVQRVRTEDPSFVLHYTGTEWVVDPVSTAFPAHFDKVWGTSNDDVWISGRIAVPLFPFPNEFVNEGQVVHRRSDEASGFTWQKDQPTPTSTRRATVEILGASFSKNEVLLGHFVNASSVLRYFHVGVSGNDGATFVWTQHPIADLGFSESFNAVWGPRPNDLWIAGQHGRLRHWDGVDWSIAPIALDNLPVEKTVYAIWGSGPNDIWVVGQDIALHKIAP